MKKENKIEPRKVFILAADEQEQRMFYRVQRSLHCKTASDTIRQMLVSFDEKIFGKNMPAGIERTAR